MANLYESMNKYFESKYGDDLDNVKKVEKKSLNESKRPVSRKAMKEARGRTSGKFTVQKALLDAHLDLPRDLSPESQKTAVKKALDVLKAARAAAETDAEKKQYDNAINILTNRPTPVAFNSLGAWYSGISMSEQMGSRKVESLKSAPSRLSYGTKNKINEAAGFPKYFLAFDHFEPDTLFTIKVNDEKQLKALKGWESWYIKDITDKKGFYLIGHSDEAFYLNKLPASNKEALRKLMVDELKQKIKEDEEFFDYLETHLDCIDEDVSLDLDLSEDDDEAAVQIADNWFESIDDSYVDGDSSFEFKFVTMEEEKKNAADFSEFDSESGDEGFDESFKRASKSKINRKKVESLKSAPKRHKLGESKRIVSRKAMKEDLGEDIAKYQRYVDYDMKHYGKISKKTQDLIDKAGLQVVKDQYGDYEVTAGHYEEACRSRKSMGLKKKSEITEAKEEKDLWDIIYGELTEDGSQYIVPETGKPRINKGAGYKFDDQIAVDRAGNIVVKTREERDLKAAIDIADKYKDKGVTYNIDQSKYDKNYPYWMTIEIPEEYKECFKESKLTEKHWEYSVSNSVSREFRDAIQSDDEDYERVRRAIIAVYDDIHENAPELLDDDDYEDWVTEEAKVVDLDDDDDVNYLLTNLYDFCDNANIWIGI